MPAVSNLEIIMHGAQRAYTLPLHLLPLTYDENLLGLAFRYLGQDRIWIRSGLSEQEERFVINHELRHIGAFSGKNPHPDCRADGKKFSEISFYSF